MVRSGGLRGFPAVISSLGLDAQALLKRYRIPVNLEDDDEQMVSLAAYAELYEECVRLTGCWDLGLRVAQQQDIHILGPLSVAMQHSTDVREAIQVCSKYLHVQSPALRLELHENDPADANWAEVRLLVDMPGRPQMTQLFDQSIGDLHLILSFLAGAGYPLRQVSLPHSPKAPLPVYQRFFGDVPIATAEEHGGLHIDKSCLSQPLAGVNQTLRQMSTDFLRMAYSGVPRSVSEQVRRIISRTLSTTQGRKEAVAGLMYTHPRTLQRRLQAEGTTYETICRSVRKEAVLRYLRQTQMPFSQIASLVGFSDHSALTRACRSWFKMTPSEIRRASRLDT